MSYTDVLIWAIAIEAALLVTLASATAGCRALRQSRKRRHARRIGSLCALVTSLDFDEPDADQLDRLRRLAQRRWLVVEPMIASRISVRTTAHPALRALLVERGTTATAFLRVRRRGAVGRARAAQLLAAVQCDSASAALTTLLDDRDPAVRAVAVRGLARVGDADAARALMARLESRRSLPDLLVLHALVSIGPAAVPSLIEGLSSPSRRAHALVTDAFGLLHRSEPPSVVTTTPWEEPTRARTRAAHTRTRSNSRSTAARLRAAPDPSETLAVHMSTGVPRDPSSREVALAAASDIHRVARQRPVASFAELMQHDQLEPASHGA